MDNIKVCVFFNIFRTRILRHRASELNLNIRSDGYVKVQDLLKLNMKTFANIPLRSHTVDEIKEVGSVNTCLSRFIFVSLSSLLESLHGSSLNHGFGND